MSQKKCSFEEGRITPVGTFFLGHLGYEMSSGIFGTLLHCQSVKLNYKIPQDSFLQTQWYDINLDDNAMELQ